MPGGRHLGCCVGPSARRIGALPAFRRATDLAVGLDAVHLGRPARSAARRRLTGTLANRDTAPSPDDELSRFSWSALRTPSRSSERCSSGSRPRSSSDGLWTSDRPIVFSSIIGRVIVVNPIDTVLAAGIVGPGAAEPNVAILVELDEHP